MPLESPIQRDGDNGFIGFASRLNPLTLPAGMLQDSVNMRLDRGVATTRKGSKRLTDSVGVTGSPLTLDMPLGADQTVTSLTFSSPKATATLVGHGYITGDQINVRGATQAQYNGDFVITKLTNDTFEYTVAGSPATPATGTIVASNGPELRDDYSGGMFAAGVFASQNYDNASEYIVLVSANSATLWRDGETLVTKTFPTSPDEQCESTDTVSVVQAFNRLYVLREADRTVAGWGEKLTNASGITVSGTTATVNFASAHGYPTGARVHIDGSEITAAFNGQEYDIVDNAPGGNTSQLTITVPSGTVTDASAGIKVRRVKPPIYWDGGSGNFVRAVGGIPVGLNASFTTMPSVGWASYINNRLWFARNRDTVGISDALDGDVYDAVFNSFRVGAGGSDRIIGIHPWVEGQALVFCRNSIWLATLNQFPSSDGEDFEVNPTVTNLLLLTDEIGCSARQTIRTAGQFVFFLSDAGVYRLDSRLDLKLRGDTKPLSDPINDIFESVYQPRVEESACALWHDNRYIIALPTSSERNDGNQLVLCWNALNERWESRDIYSANTAVNHLAVSTYSNRRRIFTVPRTGNLYLLEEKTNGTDDQASGSGTNAIVGSIKTRRYDFRDMSSKRFLRTITNVVMPAGASVTTKVSTIDPDKVEDQVGSVTNSGDSSEDYHLKSPIRYKAHAAELIYETSGGRPEIRSVAIEASPKSEPATLTRTES
jgi:hypothetical protein